MNYFLSGLLIVGYIFHASMLLTADTDKNDNIKLSLIITKRVHDDKPLKPLYDVSPDRNWFVINTFKQYLNNRNQDWKAEVALFSNKSYVASTKIPVEAIDALISEKSSVE